MNIKVYHTVNCPYCHSLILWLQSHNIAFEDIDITENEEKKNEMINKTGIMTVPVVIVDDKIIINGFNLKELKEALKIN